MSAKMYARWIDSQTGRLFAIVHEPDPLLDNGCAVVMPSAGQDSRVGPQRIYLHAARRLVAEGFRVVRVDLSGTGDSATPNPKIHLDSHKAEDVEAAVEWVRKSWGTAEVYLVALCAGARVALRYAAHDPDIAGVVAWSVPTLSEGDTPYLNVQGMRRAFASKKLLTMAWWKNRFKYGFRELGMMANSLYESLCRLIGFERESWFIRCMDKYLSEGRPAQFLFGSLDDILCEEFAERFPNVPRDTMGNQCYSIIPEGVHTLATLDVQHEAIELSVEWLLLRCGADARGSQNASPGRGNRDHRAA